MGLYEISPEFDGSLIPVPVIKARLRNGTCRALEDAADEWLFGSLKGVTSRSAKADILTPWKAEDREKREILTGTGYADPAVRRGMYHRAWNSRHAHLNSRDGHYPSRRIPDSPDFASSDGDYDALAE
jgi:hypothetical protein